MAQADINQVTLVGRLPRDAEIRYSGSGFPITSFSLALTARRKKGDDWVDESHFFDCTLLGKRGESLKNYLLKGTQIAIDGKLQQDRWEQDDGNKRSRVVILVDNIQLLGSRTDSQQSPEEYNSQQAQQQANFGVRASEIPPSSNQNGSNSTEIGEFTDEDDDIPF